MGLAVTIKTFGMQFRDAASTSLQAALAEANHSYYTALKEAHAEMPRIGNAFLERIEKSGWVAKRHQFWRVAAPPGADLNRPSIMALAFPKELLHVPRANPYFLYRLIKGHERLVTSLENYFEPGALENVADAKRAGFDISELLATDFKPAAVFPYFYARIVTPKVEEEALAGHFEAPDFMLRLPARFMHLYLEALHTFLTDPERLKVERPAWYLSFTYALQGHPWSALHGSLGIVAHIMADLAIGIADTLLETFSEQLISNDPSLKETHKLAMALCAKQGVSLDNQPVSFFADLLLDPDNLECVSWLKKRENDHYKIGPILENLTPPTIEQFTTWGNDPLARFIFSVENFTKGRMGVNGILSRRFAFGRIHDERDLSWHFSLRIMYAQSTKWGFITAADGTKTRLSEEDVRLGLKIRSQDIAEKFTGIELGPI